MAWTCCGCDADMSNAVERAWKERVQIDAIDVYTAANVVTLQCPNGHWCDYGDVAPDDSTDAVGESEVAEANG